MAVALAIAFVPLPDLWSLLDDDETVAADSPAVDHDAQRVSTTVDELAVGTQPNGVEEARFVADEPPSVANGGIQLCGEESPYGTGATCTQDAGHPKSVPHRAGLKETWTMSQWDSA